MEATNEKEQKINNKEDRVGRDLLAEWQEVLNLKQDRRKSQIRRDDSQTEEQGWPAIWSEHEWMRETNTIKM